LKKNLRQGSPTGSAANGSQLFRSGTVMPDCPAAPATTPVRIDRACEIDCGSRVVSCLRLYCANKFALERDLCGSTAIRIDSFQHRFGHRSTRTFPNAVAANSPAPADGEHVAGYGPFSSIRETFAESFRQLFASGDAPDLQIVAVAILRLIETPAKLGPLRTVCGPDYGATLINEQTAPIQAVLRASGMADMASRAQTAG
jgi:hypothetical protein